MTPSDLERARWVAEYVARSGHTSTERECWVYLGEALDRIGELERELLASLQARLAARDGWAL